MVGTFGTLKSLLQSSLKEAFSFAAALHCPVFFFVVVVVPLAAMLWDAMATDFGSFMQLLALLLLLKLAIMGIFD